MRTPLQKGENILLITRTSWITLVGPGFILIAGIVLSYFIGFTDWGLLVSLPALVYFIYKILEWRVNIWGVTNCRVIDEAGLFSHFAKESPLEKINNVSYDQSLIGRIFNFGHVEIQTAAEIGATDYFNVHEPKKLKDTITLAQSEFKNLQLSNQAVQMASALGIRYNSTSTSQPQSQSSSGNLASELEKLFELKQKGILSEDEYNRAKNKLIG